jgi:hypothetical protein
MTFNAIEYFSSLDLRLTNGAKYTTRNISMRCYYSDDFPIISLCKDPENRSRWIMFHNLSGTLLVSNASTKRELTTYIKELNSLTNGMYMEYYLNDPKLVTDTLGTKMMEIIMIDKISKIK